MDLLVSPALVVSVAVLVLNDHVFKARWPGFATGKLSDVAGVAMIAIALAALTGWPRGSIVATAAGFTALKTVGAVAVVASPVLGGVTRTDPTDLVALVVLVPIWRWLAARRAVRFAVAPAAEGGQLVRRRARHVGDELCDR